MNRSQRYTSDTISVAAKEAVDIQLGIEASYPIITGKPVMNDVVCPICGKEGSYAFGGESWKANHEGREFRHGECTACKMLFCVPTPTPAETEYVYDEYYKEYFEWFVEHRFFKRLQAWHRYRRLAGLFKQNGIAWSRGNLLDVGCGHGWFLDEALKDRWDVYGLDYLSDDLVERMTKRGLRIEKGSLESSSLPKDHFDLVAMWHVLEHMRDPRESLEIASAILKKGGHCVIAVPNRECKALQKSGLDWTWLQEPFIHVSSFSFTALEKIVPPTMRVVEVTSRDPWDQQYVQYILPFRVYRYILKYLVSGPRMLFKLAGIKPLEVLFKWIHFVLYESALLFTYAGYLLTRKFFRQYERGLKGSELMLLLEKK